MAIAHDAASESHTGTVGSISEASFGWSHAGAASGVDGVLVFVVGLVTDADDALSIDYGGKAIPAVPGAIAQDTATEPMSAKAFFYGGADIPQGTRTVTVTRNNNTNELWAVAMTVTASVAGQVGAVHEAGIVLLQADGTLAQQNVTDGSPGTNSLRYACAASGLAAFPPTGASSTALHNFDTGNQTAAVVRETTAGQGSRPVGFASGTSDDRAVVHLAIKEVVASEAHSGSALLSGGGGAAVSTAKDGRGTSLLGGGGVAAVLVAKGGQAAPVLAGGGSASSAAAKGTLAALTLSGGGTLTASGEQTAESHSGTAVLSGGGSPTVQSAKGSGAAAAMSGGGALAAVTVKGGDGAALLSGGGLPSAVSERGALGLVVILGGGTVTAEAIASRYAAVALSGGGILAALGSGAQGALPPVTYLTRSDLSEVQ